VSVQASYLPAATGEPLSIAMEGYGAFWNRMKGCASPPPRTRLVDARDSIREMRPYLIVLDKI
jgi:hypothetical protein